MSLSEISGSTPSHFGTSGAFVVSFSGWMRWLFGLSQPVSSADPAATEPSVSAPLRFKNERRDSSFFSTILYSLFQIYFNISKS